jgi:hypothetical protein
VASDFSDATTLEVHSTEPRSPYLQVQRKIRETLAETLALHDDPSLPVVVIAQFLGCQVLSNYLWDAQHGRGLWAAPPPATWATGRIRISSSRPRKRSRGC